MKLTLPIPEQIRDKFSKEVLKLYEDGILSAGRAAQMLGIPRAQFYMLLAETKTPLPHKLNESIKEELRSIIK